MLQVAGMSAQTYLIERLLGMHVARACRLDHHGRGVAILVSKSFLQGERRRATNVEVNE